MRLQEHLIEKISNTLVELEIDDKVIDNLEEYMEGNLEEEEFFKKLPSINLENLKDDTVEQIVDTYRSLDKHKAYDYFSKYIKMLFQIGKTSVFSIIDKAYYYHYQDDRFRKLLKYNLSPSLVIAYYAKCTTKQEHNLDRGFIKFYDDIYENCKDEFKEAFDISKTNEQIIIAAYLIQKEKDKQKKLCSWLEKEIIDSIGVLFSNSIISSDAEILAKYLKGETSNLVETIDILMKSKKNLILNIDTYILRFLIGISSTISNESDMANRFIKFAILFDYEKSFNGLYLYLKYNRHNKITEFIEKLQIRRELYIAWIGHRNSFRTYDYTFEKELKGELKENREEFKKAIKMCYGVNKIYMASLLWQDGECLEFAGEGEDVFIHEFSVFMDKLEVKRDVYENFIEYLRGNISFDGIKETLQNLLGKKDIYIYYYHFCRVLFWLKGISPMFEKGMKIFITIGNPDVLRYIYNDYKKFAGMKIGEEDLNSFIELLESCGASMINYIPFLGTYAFGTYVKDILRDQSINIIAKLIEKDEEQVIRKIPYCQAEVRTGLLEVLDEYCHESKGAEVLIEYLGDSSKSVREKAIELLTLRQQNHEMVIPSLTAKKQSIREAAVRILSNNTNEKVIEALNNALEVEKTEKIKALLREALNVESALEENKEDLNILEYCKQALKGNKGASLKWLDCDTLPKVKFKDSDKVAENEIIKYMLICYSSGIAIGLSSEARVVSELLDEKDLSKFALEVLQRWINSGAESKKKWVLPFAAVYGEYDVVSLLKKNIEEWPKKSRGAIASDAVKSLALNGSNEALIIVDNISRKFKFKQVKNAAATALQFAAEQMGIDKEELSDRIVPDLAFDIREERVFDYGERKFIVTLTQELTLEVQDEKGKKFKNIPSPGKKDDETKAQAAFLEFKNLKKQLKTVANIQTIRLEMALSSNRKWTKEAWVKLFVENPIMNQFAIGLVWGIYKDNKLTDSFRYMEDGSFNTKDEDEYSLEDDVLIGLVHPIELPKDDLELWKEQLENYEIRQPFDQLNREVFVISKEENAMKNVERFGGIMLNGLSLLGKLTGFGWSRGSIEDGGCYYTFYKEDKDLKIGVELNFSGVSVGYENEEVTVYDLTFYKEGTVKRESYVYYKTKDQNTINISEVPNRFFSEILYQINKATASKTSTNEKWKEEKI